MGGSIALGEGGGGGLQVQVELSTRTAQVSRICVNTGVNAGVNAGVNTVVNTGYQGKITDNFMTRLTLTLSEL